MSASCIICTSPLVGEQYGTPYVTSCGHTYHKECLLQWLETKHACPICKKNCTERNIKPLYLNMDYDKDTYPDVTPQVENLKKQVEALKKNCKQAEARSKVLAEMNEDHVATITELKRERKKATQKFNNMKQVKRVADLDDAMRSPTALKYMEKINDFTKEQLHVALVAMCQKLRNSNRQHEKVIAQLNDQQNSIKMLKRRIKDYKDKLRSTEGQVDDTVHPQPTDTINDVIVLDSDSDDTTRQVNQGSPMKETERTRSPSVELQSSSPLRHKRVAPELSSSKRSKGKAPVLHDLSDDDVPESSKRRFSVSFLSDDEFEVEEHDSTNEGDFSRYQKRRLDF